MNFILFVTIAFGYLINHAQALNLPCSTTEECLPSIQNSICNEDTKKCDCPDKTVLSSDLEICLPIADGYESSCQDNTQCSAALSIGGICSDGACKCGDGFHYLKDACWKNVGLDETCSETEQCYQSYEYIGFKCDDGKCKCKDGFYERHGSACRRVMGEGDVCFIDEDCWCGDKQSGRCASSRCTCPGSKYSISYEDAEVEDKDVDFMSKETCPPGSFPTGNTCKLELGIECTMKDECGAPRSNCTENVCACVQFDANNKFSANSVASSDNRKCLLPLSTIDSATPCTENGQCATFGGNALCEEKKCKCTDSSHYVKEDKFCYTTKNLGEDCSGDKDCYTSNGPSVCDNNKCKCQDGYHPSSNDCFKDAFHVGEGCHADDDCLFDHGKCDDKICACEDGFFASEGLCIQGVHSTCQDDSQCSHVVNSTCNSTTGICECLEGFVSSGNEEFCLLVTDYEGPCTETVQCNDTLGELKECRNGLCACQESSHFSKGKCYETKQLSEECLNKNECIYGQDPDGVFCLNGRCACQYDYVKNSDNKCVKDDSDKDNSGNNQQLSILLMTSSAFLLLFKKI